MTTQRTSATGTLEPAAAPVATRPGRFGKAQFGASMPLDAPYYQAPPFYYRDARAIQVAYETDVDAALDVLPEGVDLPLPARAALIVVHYPFSTFGPYLEAISGLSCLWQGQPRFYIAHIAVDTVPPLVAGREIWGFPKKLAHIELSVQGEFLRGTLERPAGVRLITVAMRLERPVEGPTEGGGGSLSLRVIPSAEEGRPPALAELIEVPSLGNVVHEAWTGPATVAYDTASTLDPWHRLPVRQILGASYSRYDFTLPGGRVVRTY